MIFTEISDFKKFLPNSGRILALDVGTKRIGIAICDDTQNISTPKLIINRQSNQKDFAIIASIIQENHVVAVVIGLPLKMDGGKSEMSEFISRFAKGFDFFLESSPQTEIPIMLFDERLSSFEARNIIRKSSSKRKFYDDISASLVLEHLLNDLRECQN